MPNITKGTLEGDIIPGDITFFRLQSTADAKLSAYVAEGEVLPVAFGHFGEAIHNLFASNKVILDSLIRLHKLFIVQNI